MMLEPTLMTDTIDLTLLDALAESELETQREIVRARNYHAGQHPTFLTDRLAEFLSVDKDDDFHINLCRVIVRAVSERLIVSGFGCKDKDQAAWMQTLWQVNRMDAKSADVMEDALASRESFVIVDWDRTLARPRFNPHPRYTSADLTVDGDEFGCRAFYPSDDPNQPMLYATKQWVENFANARGKTDQRRRLTVYFPNRIERYVHDGTRYVQFNQEGLAWQEPWVDKAGKPLGIPVAHFVNYGLEPESKEAQGPQDALNKTVLDLLGSADQRGIPITFAKGFILTTDGKPLAADGSNQLSVEPGTVISSPNPDADMKDLPGADLTPLLALKDSLAFDAAIVTGTPVSRFNTTRAVASADTLKEQSEPLMAKVRNRQVLFGNAWEDVMSMARRLQNAFGGGVDGAELDETLTISTQWTAAQTRATADKVAEAGGKSASGVPQEQIWRDVWGYTEEEIVTMKAMPEFQARLALMQSGLNALTQSQEG